jgi:glycosyltransferase involved in cell wall biosynthesis
MRIAYVVLHLDRKIMQGGVGKKIVAQLSIWKQMGHDAHLFLHSPDRIQLPDTTTFTYQPSDQVKTNILAREINRYRALGTMIREIKSFKPDIIYLRYGMFSLPLPHLYQIAPVIVELNGDDVSEYRYRGLFFYLLNRTTRHRILGPAAGFVALSGEIADLQCNSGYHKPNLVLANGVDMHAYDPQPAPANEKPHLGMVFSAMFPWHGLDKLIWLARKYPQVCIELAGYGLDVEGGLPPNVIYHGFLEPERLHQMMARLDVSVGTLALHRKNMQEASPLKVREALACGIPCLLAYKDTDLTSLEADFILNIPNTEENVEANAEEIVAFAMRMQGKRVNIQAVAPRIDQHAKEEQRLKFMLNVLQS